MLIASVVKEGFAKQGKGKAKERPGADILCPAAKRARRAQARLAMGQGDYFARANAAAPLPAMRPQVKALEMVKPM